MTTRGYIVIADITGYTVFLKESELEHAQDSLRGLLEMLIEQTRPPLVISRLEGDAVISYAPEGGFLQGQTLVEMIENCYVAFRTARQNMRLNTTCTCNACRNIPNLDLKFFVNFGTFALQKMTTYTELVGNDVNVTHRLVKNHIREQTGIGAYAAYTEQAVEALGIGEFASQMQQHMEQFPDVGEIQLYIQDLEPVWQQEHERRRIFVEPEKAVFIVEIEIPAPAPLVWDYFTKPQYRMILEDVDGMPVENQHLGRMAEGTVYVCAHGDSQIRQAIVDWRPFEYYTYETEIPMGATGPATVRFDPIDEGQCTRVRVIAGNPSGPFLVRLLMLSPLMKGKLIASTKKGMKALKQIIQKDLESGAATFPEPGAISEGLLGEAVSTSLAESTSGN
jgi:hypothetical protein